MKSTSIEITPDVYALRKFRHIKNFTFCDNIGELPIHSVEMRPFFSEGEKLIGWCDNRNHLEKSGLHVEHFLVFSSKSVFDVRDGRVLKVNYGSVSRIDWQGEKCELGNGGKLTLHLVDGGCADLEVNHVSDQGALLFTVWLYLLHVC